MPDIEIDGLDIEIDGEAMFVDSEDSDDQSEIIIRFVHELRSE